MHWMIAMAGCLLALGCAAEDEAPATVSTGEGNDGGGETGGGGPYVPIGGGSRSDAGDGDGDEPGRPDGGGPLLSDLDSDGLAELCDGVAEIIEDERLSAAELTAVSCAYTALFNVDIMESSGVPVANPLQCREHVADCITFSSGTGRLSCETEPFAAAAARCDVGVDDYTACVTVGLEAFAEAVDVLTCENLSNPDESEQAFRSAIALEPFTHEECAGIAALCPMLFGGALSGPPAEDGCDETCRYTDDGICDDGGLDAQTGLCALGTDCLDCGRR